MPRFGSSNGAGGILDDLKTRLGFGGGDDRPDEDYEDFADYEDYEDYEDYDDEYEGYGPDYDRGASVGGYRPATARAGRSSATRGSASGPRLVSIDDVKSHTAVPDRLMRDPLASEAPAGSASRVGNRTVLDETVPPVSSPAHNAALRDSRQRSEGLDSLFEPTTSGAYDPYEAYSSSNPATHTPVRSLTVLRPVTYGDVERVARAVKSGDVVVLVMRATPDDLSKRILDFSFGVASALDANVECPGEKVFAIARGNALSEDEKRRLRNQGAL